MADSIKAKMAALAQQRERLAAAQQRRQSQTGSDRYNVSETAVHKPTVSAGQASWPNGLQAGVTSSPITDAGSRAGLSNFVRPALGPSPVAGADSGVPSAQSAAFPFSAPPIFQLPRPVLTKPAVPVQTALHSVFGASRPNASGLASSSALPAILGPSTACQPSAGPFARTGSNTLQRPSSAASPFSANLHAPVSSAAEVESFFSSDDASCSQAGGGIGDLQSRNWPASMAPQAPSHWPDVQGESADRVSRTDLPSGPMPNGADAHALKAASLSSQSPGSKLTSPFAHASQNSSSQALPDSLLQQPEASNGQAPQAQAAASVPPFLPHHTPAATQSHDEDWFNSMSPSAQTASHSQAAQLQHGAAHAQHAIQSRSAFYPAAHAPAWGNQGSQAAHPAHSGRADSHPWAAAAATGLSPPPSQTGSIASSPGSTAWSTHLHMQHYSKPDDPYSSADAQQEPAGGSAWFDAAASQPQAAAQPQHAPSLGPPQQFQSHSQPQSQSQPQQQWQQTPHAAPSSSFAQAQAPSWEGQQQQQSQTTSGHAFAVPKPARTAFALASAGLQHAGSSAFARGGSSQHSWGSSTSLAQTGNATQHCDFPKEGRPAAALVAFGFGGNVVVFKPRRQEPTGVKQPAQTWQPAGGRMHDGRLQMLRLSTLPAALASQQPDRTTQAQGGLHDDTADLLQRFPGPLTPSTPASRVVAFLAEQEEAAAGTTDGLRELYGVLRVLAEHNGSLHAATNAKGSPSKDQRQSPGAALAAVLAPEDGVQQSRAVLTAAPADSAGRQHAAKHMQLFLMSDRKAEALRVAQEAGLWGPALLVARSLGEAAFQACAAAMAAATLAPGQPLHTLCLLLAGQLPASILPPAAQPGEGASQQEHNAAQELMQSWSSNLAMLSANAAPGSEALITQLGDQLHATSGQAAAAHACYVAAGALPQLLEPGARLCLPGADHRGRSRSFAGSVAALQRSEALEWARCQGNAAFAQQALPWLPYRLLYAVSLAEHGHVSAASGYAARLVQVLGSLQRPPPNLLVVRSIAADLSQRLQVHASAFNITITHAHSGSMLTSVGKWLDRGINKLMGGGSGPPSNASSDTGLDPAAAAAAHLGLRVTPSSMGPSPAGTAPSSPRTRGHQRSASAADMSSSTHAGTPAHHGAASMDTSSGPASTGRLPGAGAVRSVLGKVGSLGMLLGGGSSGAASTSGPASKDDRIGEENAFYFDNDLKQWRERGAPPPAAPAEVTPPPLAAKPPTQAAPAFHSPARQPGDVRSRYVDTLSSARTSSGQIPPFASSTPQRPAFLPSPSGAPGGAAFMARSASGTAPTPPGPPKFFMPPLPKSTSSGSLQGGNQPLWQASQQRSAALQNGSAFAAQLQPHPHPAAAAFSRADSGAPAVIDASPPIQGTDYYTSYLDVQPALGHHQQHQQQRLEHGQNATDHSSGSQQWGQATGDEAAFFDQQEMTELQL